MDPLVFLFIGIILWMVLTWRPQESDFLFDTDKINAKVEALDAKVIWRREWTKKITASPWLAISRGLSEDQKILLEQEYQKELKVYTDSKAKVEKEKDNYDPVTQFTFYDLTEDEMLALFKKLRDWRARIVTNQ